MGSRSILGPMGSRSSPLDLGAPVPAPLLGCRSRVLHSIRLLDFRGYASLDATFGPGPHLVWGPNAAGKTSLLEAMVLLAWGHSHRTAADGELIRWATDLARVEGVVGSDVIEVAVVRAGAGATAGRKRIRVNGLGRRAAGLAGLLRVVVFAPEEMLLIAGSPSLRRAALDQLAVGGLACLRGRPHDVWPDTPATQQPSSGDPRGGRLAGRAPVLGHGLPRRRRHDRRRAPAASRGPRRPAGGCSRRDRAGRGVGGSARPSLRDERPAAPR